MTTIPQDRLVRKEVSLGQIRDLEPPKTHIGLSVAPWLDVESDDVIFQYAAPEVDGLAPARAEDAESELAQKDDTIGSGRASLIDWALKDHYDASDVSRYREFLEIARLAGGANLPLTVARAIDGFESQLARDARLRRRKLDNRIEWLIMQSLDKGKIVYNDGKINFVVDWQRPANQQDQAPASGKLWTSDEADPIGDTEAIKQQVIDDHGVELTRAIASRKVIAAILNSDRFAARSGVAGVGGYPIDPKYLIDGWGVEAAKAVYERQTGVTLIEYDSVYRTRAIGSKTTVNNRFIDEGSLIFLPGQAELDEIAGESEMGFARTLTSPHPEGGWSSGFYEWEKDTGPDPWGFDRGSGVKAFPVFPHMEYTYVLKPIG